MGFSVKRRFALSVIQGFWYQSITEPLKVESRHLRLRLIYFLVKCLYFSTIICFYLQVIIKKFTFPLIEIALIGKFGIADCRFRISKLWNAGGLGDWGIADCRFRISKLRKAGGLRDWGIADCRFRISKLRKAGRLGIEGLRIVDFGFRNCGVQAD
jgi:hypothetical protein